MYANTDEGSSALWVCDEDGVVTDNISYSGNERAPILEQINEYYGTSFTGWSDNEIGLQIGASIPNWATYEKIKRTLIAVKQATQAPTAWYGYLQGSKFNLATVDSGEKVNVVTVATGKVSSQIAWNQNLENTVYQAVHNSYPECDDIGVYDVTEGMNDDVPNWADYDVINPD